jgi:hypothetical protein
MEECIMTIFKQLQTPIILAALLLLTATGLVTGWATRLTAPLTQRNLAFLDDSIKDTFHLMIPVGAAKAAADIVEGSTVNVEAGAVFAKAGMTIEAGDTLQPLLDYIEVAWNLLLVSMIYLVTAKCVVSGASATAGPLLAAALGAFLLNSLVALAAAKQHALRQALQRLGAIFLLCSLLFLLIIPLTVAGSAYLSRHTTDPMRAEVSASFQQIGQAFSLDRFHATDDLKEKATVLKDKLLELERYAKDAVPDVAGAACKLAAVKLLNGIVFPLASFAFLIWLVRGCLCPALGLSDRPLTQDDLRQLSDWIRRPRHPPPPPAQAPAEEAPRA